MEQELATIVIYMEGGIVQDVSATGPVRVIFIEYDKNMNPREDPERFIALNGSALYHTDLRPQGSVKSQELVSEVVAILDQAPHCDQCGGPRVNERWEYTDNDFISGQDHKMKLCWFCWREQV